MAGDADSERPDVLIATLLRERGSRVLEDPALCKALLSDAFGARGREGRHQVRLLVAAVDAGVGAHFSQETGGPLPDRKAIALRMSQSHGVALAEAAWAVDTWYAAYARYAGQRVPTAPPPPSSTADRPVTPPLGPRPASGPGGQPPPPPRPVKSGMKRWVIAALIALPILVLGGVAAAIIASQPEEEPYYDPCYDYGDCYPDTTVSTAPNLKSYKVVHTCELGPQCAVSVYSGPGLNYAELGTVREGAYVSVVCQAAGTSIKPKDPQLPSTIVWNKLSDGRWLTDAYLLTGYDGFSPELARCP